MHALAAPDLGSPPLRRYGLPAYNERQNPAAGAHFSEQPRGLYRTRLLSVFCRLVTDATAANRTVLVEYRDDGDQRYMISAAPVTQAATNTNDWVFDVWQGQAEWTVDDSIIVPLKPLILPPLHDFRIFVDNIQVGDQLSLIRFWWEQFFAESPPTPSDH